MWFRRQLMYAMGILLFFTFHRTLIQGFCIICIMFIDAINWKEHRCSILIRDRILTAWYRDESSCSYRSNMRGSGQSVIAISIFGPKENEIFQINASMELLLELLDEARLIYPGWIVRIYHDDTVTSDIAHRFERKYDNVDFCDMKSLKCLSPKIWRFLPAVDPNVNISEYSRFIHFSIISRFYYHICSFYTLI